MFVNELADVLCELQSRIRDPSRHLSDHISPEQFQSISHVRQGRGLCYSDEERRKLEEGSVPGVREPRLDENAVLGLELEVFRDVVDYDGSGEVSADAGEVLHIEAARGGRRMLPVQSVADELGVRQVAQGPVGVVWHRRGEDDELVVGRQGA